MVLFPHNRNQLFIAGCVCLGFFVVGNAMGWCTATIPKLQDPKRTPLSSVISLTQASWVGSTILLGITVGPMGTAYISTKLGRKKCLLISAVFMTIANLILLFPQSLYMIYGARIIIGIAAGLHCITSFVYIGEIASKNSRGFLMSLTTISYNVGVLVIYSVGLYTSYLITGFMTLLTSVMYLIGCFFIPESPLSHLLQGKEDKAVHTLCYLGRASETEEMKAMICKSSMYNANNWKWSEIYSNKANRNSLFIGFWMLFFQPGCGMLASSYFADYIFKTAKSSIDPSKSTVVIGATLFLGTLVVPHLIERNGRRILMLLSTAGCFISCVTLGGYFYIQTLNSFSLESVRWLPLASLILSFFSYSIGLGIVPDIVLGEIFRPNVRSVGTAIIVTSVGSIAVIITTSFGYIVEVVGVHYIFWVFAVVNAMAFGFTIKFLPETKGMDLAEIQAKLSN